jgi:hypothetical protein
MVPRFVISYVLWWKELKPAWFICIGLAMNLAAGLIITPFQYIFKNFEPNTKTDFNTILAATVLAPIVETLFFQSFMIYLINRFITKKILPQILISSVIFGLAHHHHVVAMLYTFIGGLIFSTGYVLYKRKTDWVVAFWYVALIHAFHNIFVVAHTMYFQ